MARTAWRLALVLGLVVAGCGDDGDGDRLPAGDADGDAGQDAATGTPQVVSESFVVRESVEQLHVYGAAADLALEVVDAKGDVVASGKTDAQGSLIFRKLTPGLGYVVRVKDADPADYTDQLEVMSVENSLPDDPDEFYAQELKPGFNYITTRDGTTLSAFVTLPGPIEKGPYPTVVNYSGYSPSQPGSPLESGEDFCDVFPILCDAPHDQSALIAGMMGYATVGVNLRGTGCSGGAYDYWETLQVLDGYDIIEVVGRQSWVMHNKVGMTGLSYPGISQLFVAQTRPPHLAAITPMSVIADTSTSTLAPGGIFNEGFAFRWAEGVYNGAAPFGKGWEMDVVADEKKNGGESICEVNQLLHGQRIDSIEKAKANAYYNDEVAKPLDPTTFVDEIDVPVFLSGQWQDEQTGPHFPALFDKFTRSPLVRFTVTNGVHPDGFAPQILSEWKTFLDLYVAKKVPSIDNGIKLLAPQLFAAVFGESLQIPDSRFSDAGSWEEAKQRYEAEDELRVIFETGASPELTNPGAPLGTFETRFSSWPLEETVATRWYFQPDGTLGTTKPAASGGASSFVHDAQAGGRTTLAEGVGSSDEVWNPQPRYDYRSLIAGKAVAFESAPLDEDVVMIGHGSVDLYVQSTADDADLEVNLTEVRADGQESYVQSGWLRASQRKLRADATELRPTHTHREEDVQKLPKGEWTLVRVELMPFGHIFRAGSRIRISVDTPGDSRAAWRFILLEHDTPPTHSIAHDAAHPSSLVLPVIPGVEVPTDVPDCTALRGQPCRAYEALANTPM